MRPSLTTLYWLRTGNRRVWDRVITKINNRGPIITASALTGEGMAWKMRVNHVTLLSSSRMGRTMDMICSN